MDEEVREEFNNLNTKLDAFILTQTEAMSLVRERVRGNEQRFENGDKAKNDVIKHKALRMSFDRLVVTIVVGGFGIWQIIKEVLV